MKKAVFVVVVLAVLSLASCDMGLDTSNFNLLVTDSSASSSRASMIPEEYYVGMPREDVFSLLGSPTYIWDGGNQQAITDLSNHTADAYYHFGINLTFLIMGSEVVELTIESDQWVCSNGLICGMSPNEFEAIMGSDYLLNQYEFRDYYRFKQYGVVIEVSKPDGTIDQIGIDEDNAR